MNLLAGNLTQAFDLSLQLIVKTAALEASATDEVQRRTGEQIFEAFLFYLRASTGEAAEAATPAEEDEEDDEEARQLARQLTRRQLLERLISCWQDQGFSFVHLESLFTRSLAKEGQLLQTLVLTLFKPDDRGEEEEAARRANSPMLGGGGPRLVDLFTPEFCLRIGDTCVQEVGEEASKWMRKRHS